MHPQSKLPEVTFVFWVMKICATTLGETGGDLLSMTLNVGYAVSSLILLSIFFVTLTAQLVAKRFHPALFWLVILSTSTAGTTMSDYMDRTLGLGYALGSAILVAALGITLLLWRLCEGTISIQQVHTRRAEIFYWTAILFSNTLGTALGDYLADDSGFGFAGSAALIGSTIGLTVIAYYRTQISRVFLFWAAFVLTRPFGATIGDLLTKSSEKGGLDLGTIGSSAVLLIVLMVLVYRSMHTKPTHA